jgi:hypothetical protein
MDFNEVTNYDEGDEWKGKDYWMLPENVQNAIDIAKNKQPHSQFYYKL